MCMACEELQLFYAYLDAVEEAKRKAQPWECEVTLIPQGEQAAATPTPAAEAATPAQAASKAASQAASKPAKSGFSCDETE